MNFKVTVNGVTQTLKSFLTIERGVIDLRRLGAWKQVVGTFYKISKRLFETEGSTGRSGRWKALKPAYARYKVRRWGSTKILQASGRLYKSMTQKGGDSVVTEEPMSLTIGINVPYAKYHQLGTSKMVARPVIDLTEEDERQLVDPLKKKIRQLIQNARLKSTRGF